MFFEGYHGAQAGETGFQARGKRQILGNFEQDSELKSYILERLAWLSWRVAESISPALYTAAILLSSKLCTGSVTQVYDKNVASMKSISSMQTWLPLARKWKLSYLFFSESPVWPNKDYAFVGDNTSYTKT